MVDKMASASYQRSKLIELRVAKLEGAMAKARESSCDTTYSDGRVRRQ